MYEEMQTVKLLQACTLLEEPYNNTHGLTRTKEHSMCPVQEKCILMVEGEEKSKYKIWIFLLEFYDILVVE